MKLRALGDTLILQDYIPTQCRGFMMPKKLLSRFLYSTTRWGIVISVGPRVAKGSVSPGDIVLSHYDQAKALPDRPGLFCLPYRFVLAKTKLNPKTWR
jgi:hypothetical protein